MTLRDNNLAQQLVIKIGVYPETSVNTHHQALNLYHTLASMCCTQFTRKLFTTLMLGISPESKRVDISASTMHLGADLVGVGSPGGL